MKTRKMKLMGNVNFEILSKLQLAKLTGGVNGDANVPNPVKDQTGTTIPPKLISIILK